MVFLELLTINFYDKYGQNSTQNIAINLSADKESPNLQGDGMSGKKSYNKFIGAGYIINCLFIKSCTI